MRCILPQQIKSSIYYLHTTLWKGTLVWAQLGGSAAHMWLTYAWGPSWEVGAAGMAVCTLPSPAALIGLFPCWLHEAEGAASPLSPGLECVHSHFCLILSESVSRQPTFKKWENRLSLLRNVVANVCEPLNYLPACLTSSCLLLLREIIPFICLFMAYFH